MGKLVSPVEWPGEGWPAPAAERDWAGRPRDSDSPCGISPRFCLSLVLALPSLKLN